MSNTVTFLIADDHVVLREGLKALLKSVDGWDVVAEANDGLEVMPLFEEHKPDLVVLDLRMPNLGGVETIKRLKREREDTIILVLSAKDDDKSVREAMRAGANGFVPKSSQSNELEFAIRSVLKGQTYLSPTVCDAMLGVDGSEEGSSPLASLTDREREVMKLLSEGMPNRDVAKTLHISPRTVDSHRANIMKKLGVTSNAELVQIALRNGLIE
ncbi:MAG: response regulator transcription factor [Bdellovibrionales bacterium]|nr:response regulator transcription factor [Bdellovibrionales bacterium]